MIWIGILFVLLLAADISVVSKKDICFTLPVSGFAISLSAYLLAWAGLLPHFRTIINGLILVFSAYAGFVLLKAGDRRERLKHVLNPGLAGYLILCLIALRAGSARFCQWDEFSHWGTVVKDMFFSGRLSIFPDSVSNYHSYPPGAALWELYFASLFKEWQDWPVIFAYNLLVIQWMMPLFGCLGSGKEAADGTRAAVKKALLTLILVLVIYLMPFLFYSPFEGLPWRCVYIDRALAFGFAWLLFMHFGTAPGQKDRFYYLSFALGAGFQCLLKGTGGLFLLLALLIIIPDVLLGGREEKKRVLVRYGKACLFPCLTVVSWYAGLRIMGVSRFWDMEGINLGTFVRLLSGQEEEWRYEIIRDYPTFLKRITLQYYHGSIVLTLPAYPLFWALGAACVSALSGRKGRGPDKRNFWIAAAGLLELLIYLLGILLIELYVLSQKEGLQLSSGQRYIAAYPLGMSVFIYFYLIRSLFSWGGDARGAGEDVGPGRKRRIWFALLMLFLLCSVSLEKAVKILTDIDHETAVSYRTTTFARYFRIEDEIGKTLGAENRCYILSEDDPLGHFILRKQFIPVRTNRETIGPETEDPCETFVREIVFGGYDHVFVNRVGKGFNEACRGLFQDRTISELSLYRVDYGDGFELKFESSYPPVAVPSQE